MLVLRFEIGGQPYAMDVAWVSEVVPRADLRPLPGAPLWAPGLLQYRQQVLPVVDLSLFAGLGPSSDAWSTRILVLRPDGNRRALGLLADRVTDVETVRESELREMPVRMVDRPWLGRVYTSPMGGHLVCVIEPAQLLPTEVADALQHASEVA